MRAEAVPVLELFLKKHQLEVPLFQRQYVWTRDGQWQPLWEDIERKFLAALEDERDVPEHFLGAMVLDQKRTPSTQVDKRQIIDGQQRLTTLQIFIAAFREIARMEGCDEIAAECTEYLDNPGRRASENDRYKVWPTQADRPQFLDVINASSFADLSSRYPRIRRRWARQDDPRPPMVEAFFFFHLCIEIFIYERRAESVEDFDVATTLDRCLSALRTTLRVVVIDLESSDDAQVIFETLNARGEPLASADLLRNFIFLRAARQNEDLESLYNEYWLPFEDGFWRQPIRQGSLSRPLGDVFMQAFLASHQRTDVPTKSLFTHYKHWIDRSHPYETVADELHAIAEGRKVFRRIFEAAPEDPLAGFFQMLSAFDISTVYPFLLHLFSSQASLPEQTIICATIESYLVRRAITQYSSKNYARIFLRLIEFASRGVSADHVRSFLASLSGDAQEWPSDSSFRAAWSRLAYGSLQGGRLEWILRRLNARLHGAFSEDVIINSELTVEHVMPQEWLRHWPLSDGSHGYSEEELANADEGDRVAEGTYERNRLVQDIGNLTLLTRGLNSSVSNGPWPQKREAIRQQSLLPMNIPIVDSTIWDEDAIKRRSESLLNSACVIWPGPASR